MSSVSASLSTPTQTVPVALCINGATHRLELDPRVTLLDALREHLGLTGTKKGCDAVSGLPLRARAECPNERSHTARENFPTNPRLFG